jgi:tripartite motif-containing protein 71
VSGVDCICACASAVNAGCGQGGGGGYTCSCCGSGAGQFSHPSGIAFDVAGHIVVVEFGNRRVQVLRYTDGAHVRFIGCSDIGNIPDPCGGVAIDSDGRIVVADTNNHRVQVLE